MNTIGSSFGGPTFTRPKARLRETVPGRLIVKVKDDAVRPAFSGPRLAFSREQARKLPGPVREPFVDLRKNAGLEEVSALFSARRYGLKRMSHGPATQHSIQLQSSVADAESEELAGINVLTIDPKKIEANLIRKIAASPAIEYAEPMPARWLSPAPPAPDPMANLQWGLRAVRWFQARAAGKISASRSISVAVIDSGVDEDHPELQGVIDHYQHVGLSPRDIVGHGTHVAGIIGAEANNQVGISGVSRCRVKAWKVLPDAPDPTYGDFMLDGERYLRALNEVMDAKVKVVNLSLGGLESSLTEAILFRRLIKSGIVVVAAMGNEFQDGNPTEYPAAYDGVIAVGAVGETLRRARFSNTGSHIDLMAPGVHILSTLPMSKSAYREETEFAAWNGTSMATPHVAAAAALLLANSPGLSPEEVRAKLRESATRLKAMRNDWTPSYGAGLLDLEALL